MRILIFLIIFSAGIIPVKSQDLPDFYLDYLQRSKSQYIDTLISELQRDKASFEKKALLGELYLLNGRNDLSTQNLDNALAEMEANHTKTEIYCRALSNKGIVLWNEGKTDLALNYLLVALSIRNERQGLDPNILADNYNNLGLVLSNEDDVVAKEYFQKALEIYNQQPNSNLDKIIQSTINLSLIESRDNQFKKSLSLLNVALEKWRRSHPTPVPTEAFILVNIANIYQKTNSFILAKDNYNEALAIYSRNYGNRNSELANVYMLIGDLHTAQSDYKSALSSNQKALIANSFSFDNQNITSLPPLEDAIKPYNQLSILIRKANIFEAYYYGYSLKKDHLVNALNTLNFCDELIKELRISRTNKKDQLALSDLASEVYQDAQRISIRLSEISLLSNDYMSQALKYSEKAKGISLLSALVESEAKNFAKIPQELINTENLLQIEMAYLNTQISVNSDKEMESKFRSVLFETKSRYDQLIKKIEIEYPEYYNLKHSSTVATLNEIQNALATDQAVLNYAYDEEADEIFLYFITNEKLKFYRISNANEVNKYLRAYRNTLIYNLKPEFEQISQQIYEWLLPLKIPSNIQKLSIIPDGELGKVPFEALLTKKTRVSTNYKNKNFLLKQYEIKYGFSITLHIDNKQRSFENSAILIAPVAFNSVFLPDLPGTNTEVDDIKLVFSNQQINIQSLLREDATENNFKNGKLNNYKYIHLATHGLVNIETPELSGVYFNKDQSEDGVLYTSEIYALNINADLVTLSACETGLGEVNRGEGIIGLGSAFTYAGAKNLIVSVWKVSDRSTAGLMTQFYQHSIDNSQSYSAGLRQAKLEMLNSEFSSPYYWAPFMLWGN
jgi:CHAT domain-containing protein/Tfp pilus assembly protein PilF